MEEPFFGKFNELMKYTDLFMLDIKHIDDEEHKKLTGQTNKNILDMAQYLSKNGKKCGYVMCLCLESPRMRDI